MDADGVLIPAPLAPHRDPTPLEVLSRFTIAQDEELPGLVWDLIDEVIKYLKTWWKSSIFVIYNSVEYANNEVKVWYQMFKE